MASRNTHRTTLKDVALRCGYSINTVSRAMRGDNAIRPETRDSILKIAKEMNYVLNASAYALRMGVTHMVALIVNDINNPYYTNFISSIDRCRNRWTASSSPRCAARIISKCWRTATFLLDCWIAGLMG